MEPAFQRGASPSPRPPPAPFADVACPCSNHPSSPAGDILFLNNQDDPIRAGDVVVFKIKDRDIPIVHRCLKVHETHDGKVQLLTKVCAACATRVLVCACVCMCVGVPEYMCAAITLS